MLAIVWLQGKNYGMPSQYEQLVERAATGENTGFSLERDTVDCRFLQPEEKQRLRDEGLHPYQPPYHVKLFSLREARAIIDRYRLGGGNKSIKKIMREVLRKAPDNSQEPLGPLLTGDVHTEWMLQRGASRLWLPIHDQDGALMEQRRISLTALHEFLEEDVNHEKINDYQFRVAVGTSYDPDPGISPWAGELLCLGEVSLGPTIEYPNYDLLSRAQRATSSC